MRDSRAVFSGLVLDGVFLVTLQRANGSPLWIPPPVPPSERDFGRPRPKKDSLWPMVKGLALFFVLYVAMIAMVALGLGIFLGVIWLVLRAFGVAL